MGDIINIATGDKWPNTYVQDHMREALSRHELRIKLMDDKAGVSVWSMSRPSTCAYSAQIIFSPEGIVLQGDIGFGSHQTGICSHSGYGIEWFSSRKSENYLCEKFLTREFVPEEAAETIAGWLKSPEDYGLEEEFQIRGLREIVSNLMDNDLVDATRLYDELNLLDVDTSEGVPGWGYNRSDAGWLCAVQQRFSELFQETELWQKGE